VLLKRITIYIACIVRRGMYRGVSGNAHEWIRLLHCHESYAGRVLSYRQIQPNQTDLGGETLQKTSPGPPG